MEIVEKLRHFLIKQDRLPPSLNDFLNGANSNDVFDKLIHPIRWLTDAENSEGITKNIRDILVNCGSYQRIFASDAEKVLGELYYQAWVTATNDKNRALTRADFVRIFSQMTSISIPISDYIGYNQGFYGLSKTTRFDFIPPLPATLITRNAVISDLKRNLLQPASPPGGAPPCLALVGMPGVGKSVLATLLAHDPEVRARYPDGVLWATLGKQPDIVSVLLGWLSVLGGQPFNVASTESASAMVRGSLVTGRFLIVVDDAWTSESVEPFRVGGPECAMVLTTRDSMVARRFGGKSQQIDKLAPDEALELLLKATEIECDSSERHSAERLVQVLEYLPLAIEIAGAQIADGMSIDSLRSAIECEIARLDLLDLTSLDDGVDDATRKRLSVIASFALSLRGIGDEMTHAFAWLGVVPEDAAFDANAMRIIWGLNDTTEAEHRLAYLRRRALIQDGGNGRRTMRRYRLHDLLHDFARWLLTEDPERTWARLGIPAYGLKLAAANELVVSRYQALAPGGLWGDLPDDGYVHHHLSYHMERAGRFDTLGSLLHQTDQEGGNSWFRACERVGRVAGFVSDLERFRRWATAEALNSPHLLSRAVSASLIKSSLISRAGTIHNALAVACIQQQLWTTAQGLDYARLSTYDTGRVWLLTALAPFFGDQWESEIVDEAFSAATAGLTSGTLLASMGVDDNTLDCLTPLLPESLKKRLITLSLVAPVNIQARMAARIAPYLDDLTRQQLVFDIAERCRPDAFGHEGEKLKALVQLAKIDTAHMKSDWDVELLERTWHLDDPESTFAVLKDITPILGMNGQMLMLAYLKTANHHILSYEILMEFGENINDDNKQIAIGIAQNLPDPIMKHWLVGRLACGLHEQEKSMLSDSIESIKQHSRDHRKFSALHDFLRRAPSTMHTEIEDAAIDAGAEYGFGQLGALALQEFSRRLSPAGLQRMTDIVVKQGTSFDQAQALPALLACVDESRVAALCQVLLQTLRTSPYSADFTPFANRIPKDFLPEFLNVCRIGDEGEAGETMASAAPFIPSLGDRRELSKALGILRARTHDVEQVRVAAASLTKELSENPDIDMANLEESVRKFMTRESYGFRVTEKNAEGLRCLLSIKSMPERFVLATSLLDKEFLTISAYDLYPYMKALVDLCPLELADRLMVIIPQVRESRDRAELFSRLAVRSGKRNVELFKKAIVEIRATPEDHFRHVWLKAWISYIPHELSPDVLSLAESCKSEVTAALNRLVALPLRSRRERRASETLIRRFNAETLVALQDTVFLKHLAEMLTDVQWRQIIDGAKKRDDFARYVLHENLQNGSGLYLEAMESLPIKRPHNFDLVHWHSFGFAVAALPESQTRHWLVDRIGKLATVGRSTSLQDLEFLLPILNSVGGPYVAREVVKSIALVQKWWP